VFVFGGFTIEFFDQARRARMLTRAGDTTRLIRMPPWSPSPSELAAYTGTFQSDEAESWFTIQVKGDTLHLVERYGETTPLRPAYRDTFVGRGFLVMFRRSPSGAIRSANLGLGRVRDLEFMRK
jgi:hypothetical protein